MPLSAADMPAGRHHSLHQWPPHAVVAVCAAACPQGPTASDPQGLAPAGPGRGPTGPGPGPGPDAPRAPRALTPTRRDRTRRSTLSEAMDLLGNETATTEADSRVGVDVGVAEQLLIAWRHILADADGTAALDVAAFNASASNASNASSVATTVLAGDYMQLGNGTAWSEHEELVHIVTMVAIAVFLGLVILATVIGNVFVIAAILLERHLQNVANYLILSLAVADLLVACLVMPLGAVYEVSQQWTLGPELCDMWTSSDVLCCTASILHLVAIALDRYWAVTNIDYIHQRTARRIGIMILVVWLVAFMVCIAPMLGWKDPGWDDRVTLDQECMVSQDIAYQIFATASSFYLPLLVILGLYWRIFQTARRRIRRRVQTSAVGGRAVPGGPGTRNPSQGGVVAGAAGGSGGLAAAVVGMIGRPLPTISEATTTTTTTAFTNVSSNNTSPEKTSFANGLEADPPTADQLSCSPYSASQHHHYPKRKKEAMDSKRERKAAKTLAIITGAFVMCWLPFFIMAILQPVCDTCYFNKFLVSFFLWLGYFNSTLNPIIYTIFSPEFRHAFKRLLCGRRATLRRRNNRHLAGRGRQL